MRMKSSVHAAGKRQEHTPKLAVRAMCYTCDVQGFTHRHKLLVVMHVGRECCSWIM
jgi:hypothetical protein